MNLKYMKVSLFEITYKKKLTFSRHSNLLRCTCISAIKSSDDQVTTNPVAINEIFKGFYTNLYKAKTDFDEPICKQYLDKLELPRISQMGKESLEAPLSLEELHVSLKSLQKGKSPSLDSLPPELYLEIWDLVGTLMLNSRGVNVNALTHVINKKKLTR